MTAIEAIGRADELQPNSFSSEEKLKWLTTLDGTIKNEIIDTHEGDEDVNAVDYSEAPNAELLAQHPHDEMYVHFLLSRIDYYNGEYGRFNNTSSVFNSLYSSFERAYNRKHMPKAQKLKYW